MKGQATLNWQQSLERSTNGVDTLNMHFVSCQLKVDLHVLVILAFLW